MRIGVLTGGGDCPGLNAVIRAIVRKGVEQLRPRVRRLSRRLARAARGRQPPARRARGARHPAPRRHDPRLLADQPLQGGRRRRADRREPGGRRGRGLIAIGGEDTLGAAARLHAEHGVRVVGVPKTIDNDLGATDYTFGFDTAVNIAMEAIDRLHTTADSHHRVLIVEVMGRHAGWIAFHAGLAGGANVILIPEQPFDLDEVCELVGRRFESALRADRRRLRGRPAAGRDAGGPGRGARRLRPRPPRRHRPLARGRDRAADRQGDARHGARPRPARRHADRLRPRARDPLRPARDRRRRGGASGAR